MLKTHNHIAPSTNLSKFLAQNTAYYIASTPWADRDLFSTMQNYDLLAIIYKSIKKFLNVFSKQHANAQISLVRRKNYHERQKIAFLDVCWGTTFENLVNFAPNTKNKSVSDSSLHYAEVGLCIVCRTKWRHRKECSHVLRWCFT